MSTMTSVPPKMGRASGCAALISSASCQLPGRKNSNSVPPFFSALFDQVDKLEAALAHPHESLVRDAELGQHDEGQQRERHEGVVEPAAGPEERLAYRPGPRRH